MTRLFEVLAKMTMFATAACLALAIVAVPTNVKADENNCITVCGEMPDAKSDPKGYSSWVVCVQSHSRECETLNKCFKECGTRPDPDRDPNGYAQWADCIRVHVECTSLLGYGCGLDACDNGCRGEGSDDCDGLQISCNNTGGGEPNCETCKCLFARGYMRCRCRLRP